MELCSGLGGIGIGLRELGFETVRAYDSWEEAVGVYNHNSPTNIAVTADLLDSKVLETFASDCKTLGEIEILAAGPPCKGFSQLRNGRHDGRRRSNKTHNRVLAIIPQYVAMLRPRLVLIENVPALVNHRKGLTLRTILQNLAAPAPDVRYRVEYNIYDAAHFGTPQSRKRLLILAVREGDGNEHLPSPMPDLVALFAAVRHGRPVPDDLMPFAAQLQDPQNLQLTTAEQALSDLPDLGPGQPECARLYASTPQTAYQKWARKGQTGQTVDGTCTPAVREETVERLRYVTPGGCARHIPSEHLNGLARRYDSAYRRLHPNAPSTALSTKYDCVYHYAHRRALSLREYARLQGLPDHFKFPQSIVCRRGAYEMIGNSVPPRLIQGVLGDVLLTAKRTKGA